MGAHEQQRRNILLAVDDTPASENATAWTVDNLLKPGDEVHFFHVVSPPHAEVIGGFGGVGGVDELIAAEPDPTADRAHIEHAQEFITEKFVPRLRGAAYKVLLCCALLTFKDLLSSGHCRKVEVVRFQTDAESVAEVLCARAKDLDAVALVMASHNKGAVQHFFLGSASAYCAKNCTQPLVILH